MTPPPDDAPRPPLPTVPESFRWTDEPWGAALRCRALDPVASHLFTTRQLRLTEAQALAQLARSVGARRVLTVTQVHRADVVVVKRGAAPEDRREADVIVSNDPDVAIGVRTADCVPILLGDPATGAVAAVHAGWRGTVARASVAAVEALNREFGSRPADLVAAVGPSIGSCCYEVGSELVDAFAAAGHDRYLIDRWFQSPPPPKGTRGRAPLHLDVAGANRDQLVLAGMAESSIYMSGLCTAMNLGVLTSFRAEREQSERLAAVIVARAQ